MKWLKGAVHWVAGLVEFMLVMMTVTLALTVLAGFIIKVSYPIFEWIVGL